MFHVRTAAFSEAEDTAASAFPGRPEVLWGSAGSPVLSPPRGVSTRAFSLQVLLRVRRLPACRTEPVTAGFVP